MRKSVVVVLIIISILLGGGGVFVGWYFYNQDVVEKLTGQVTVLQASIDSIGSIIDTYTVRTKVASGMLITEDMLEVQSVPSSMLNESYVLYSEDIIGKYAKVTIIPGTPITQDILMSDDINNEKALYNTIREYDVAAVGWPIGLKIGDYVDLRIIMPYGEEYIVLSHMRVYGMSNSTVKFILTEVQINLYQSALVDYYLNAQRGVSLYFTKYLEPGIQKPANITYKVSDEIKEAMQKNSNLYTTAWASVYDATVRNDIEGDMPNTENDKEILASTKQSTIKSGRDSWFSAISGGSDSYVDEEILNGEDEEEGGIVW